MLPPRPPPNAPPPIDPALPSPLAVVPSAVPPRPVTAGSLLGSCTHPALPAPDRQSAALGASAAFAGALTFSDDASNGAASRNCPPVGVLETFEFTASAWMAALDSASHLPIPSKNEPACAPPASKTSTAPAVAFRTPRNM
ncbi:hypothetical protein [Trinickia dabaoshanensis]|uniref:hypothetical protein n=1 Tax=Trinickia dabaoshanensis TaxID=564714 RepID=UPI000C8823A7|nr:hypothetical protein [Trinickia dabaoshanensis]